MGGWTLADTAAETADRPGGGVGGLALKTQGHAALEAKGSVGG